MRAVVLHGVTDPAAVSVSSAPDPQPGPGEVIVRIRAAALNHRDLYICRGQYSGLRFPSILGSDGAGEVVAVGPAGDAAVLGQAVVVDPALGWGQDPTVQGPNFRILGVPDDGTFAELVRVPATNIYPRPAGLSDSAAAAIPLAGLTAYRALVTRGGLKTGERVLITGIGGGVATIALRFAHRLGARVYVTSGSDAKLARARELGATAGYNYRTEDWVAALRRDTSGGPDLVLDSVGGAQFEEVIDAARPGGRIVTYGASAGNAPKLTVRRLYWKQLTVLGSTMGSPADFSAMLRLFGGTVQPIIDREFPLSAVGQALAHLEQGQQFGKVVLTVP